MEIGTIFTLDQYAEAYTYVVANNCKIEEIEPEDNTRRYQIQAIPEPTVEELQTKVRANRNALLEATDKYVSVPDFPIDDDTRNQYIEYRQYLRDYTKAENWWLTNPLAFEEWVINK
jgi:hypothetical protein